MPRFIAITSRGLVEPLATELQQLQIKQVRPRPDCVEFEASWAEVYRVHLESKIATRILLPVAEFQAYNEDDLYFGILRRHDFTQYIFPHQTLRVEAHVRDHKNLRDQRFVALKTKDALVDQFRKKFNERPSVGDEDSAHLRVVVRVVGPQVSVSVDLTGESLSHRGYRRWAGEAPLRENVAAGMLKISKWKAPAALVDPFCGSGTILIEAALSLAGGAGPKRRRPFAFETLRNFQSEVWSNVRGQIPARKAPPSRPFLFGYDVDASVLDKARANARAAGVENWILFQQRSVKDLKPPTELAGWVITNPPYGVRLGSPAEARALMAEFSKSLKAGFKDWQVWLLSGDPEMSAGLKLKTSRRVPIWNGSLECRLLNYPIV